MNCIIVEDNIQDLELLRYYITQEKNLDLRGCFLNGIDAFSYINQFKPPLLFMDIDMPGIRGIDLFKKLDYKPICVFVTAHSEYALESYETHAFDFILKPCIPERFDRCISRLLEYERIKTRSDLYGTLFEEQSILLKEGSTTYKIALNEILFLEALSDYTKVVTNNKIYITLSKLKHFLEKLPAPNFIRIHRSYAVARNRIERIAGNEIKIGKHQLPIGKTYKLILRNEFALD